MNYKYFVGIDMAKHSFHCAIYKQNNKLEDFEGVNSKQGLEKLVDKLKKLKIAHKHEVLFCLEHTGIYNEHLLEWVSKHGYRLWIETALAIKRSLGLQRGKNDKVDAERIAQYAARFADKSRLWKPSRQAMVTLKALLRLRERLLVTKSRLSVPLQEAAAFLSKENARMLFSACSVSLA